MKWWIFSSIISADGIGFTDPIPEVCENDTVR